MKKFRGFVAQLLVIMMILSLIPNTVFATNDDQTNLTTVLVTDTISTTLKEGATQKGSSKTFDVVARDKNGDKIESQVSLNGENVGITWNDTDKSSYTLHFTQAGDNIVTITAGNAKVIYHINYVPANKGDVIGAATWSIEGFSLGKGYFIKPIQMNIYEGYNLAYHLEKLLTEQGLRFDYTGSLDTSFYIAGLYDGAFKTNSMWENKKGGYGISNSDIIDTNATVVSPSAIGLTLNASDEPDLNIPSELQIILDNGFSTDYSYYGRDDNNGHYGLGEFDFSNGSGWMYSLDNVFPNVGFADSYPEDGDVIRLQFTMAYGADIGGASAMGGGVGSPDTSTQLVVANKDALTYAIAKKGYENVSQENIDIAENLISTQVEVDQATKDILGDEADKLNDKAPIISNLKSVRTDKTDATIEFNSDVEGTYYYVLVDKDSNDISINTTTTGNTMTVGVNSFEIKNIATLDAKDLYIIAKNSNESLSCVYRLPVLQYVDLQAPSITAIVSTRTGENTATVKFNSDEAGQYCYKLVEKDAEAPEFTEETLTAMVIGENTISIDDIADKNAKDIYILAKDENNNSETYKGTIEEFIAANSSIVDKAMAHLDKTLEFMVNNTPAPVQETTGGDWTIMTLARAGYTVPEGYYEGWKSVVDQLFIDKAGVLSTNKYTEYSRLMLPLNALGYDPTDVSGYNILAKYADFNAVKKQGINGPIWGLIALDTNNYEIDKDALAAVDESKRNSRTKMIQYVLDKEIEGGGCALFGKTADVDMTAMAIQSLAPYYNKDNILLRAEFGDDTEGYNQMKSNINGYIDRGLAVLSSIQREDGDFASWGTVNSESTAQTLVALLSVNIDPMSDYRFIKNGKTLLDGIMKFAVDGGGFAHTYDAGDSGYNNGGGKINAMATDQSGYALVAYKRFKEGKTYLYDMSDVQRTERPDTFAPYVFDIESERLDEQNATVIFRINEPGVYYYSVDDKNVDTTTKGIKIILKSNNTISLTDLTDNKSKTVFLVAKDIHGNVNNPAIEIKINALDGADETAPTLTDLSVERLDETSAKVNFTSDEAGKYYYTVANATTEEPAIDTISTGYDMVSGVNTINLTQLINDNALIIYITAKDNNNNFITDVQKITIPVYVKTPDPTPIEVAPTLTNLSVERLNETSAKVSFTADKSGKYYYSIVNATVNEPTIDTMTSGFDMVSGVNTINLTQLTNDNDLVIYITAKVVDGKLVSDVQKITIPVYEKTPAPEPTPEPEPDKYVKDRLSAKSQLDKVFKRCDESDYTPDNWKLVVEAYNNGMKEIENAKPTDEYATEIYAALNKAIAIIVNIPISTDKTVTVCVSMDANTLGLGYLIKPTLVTIPKYEQASVVITDLLKQNGYTWENTGTIADSFYLSQVAPVDQKNVKIADFILDAAGANSIIYDDKTDLSLGEFDYCSMSGWMYSISDGKRNPSFPGVGAASWRMIDHEVMRWQFTVYGYGSDLNADNSSWGSESIIPTLGDKTDLTWYVATLRDDYSDKFLELNETYNSAMTVLTSPTADQSEINHALQDLQAVDFKNIYENGSNNDGNEDNDNDSETDNNIIVVDATVKDGVATSYVSDEDAKALLENAENVNLSTITVKVKSSENAENNIVNVPSNLIDGIQNNGMDLVIETDTISIKLSKEALNSINSSNSDNIIISLNKLDKDKLSEENQKLIGDKPAYNITVSYKDGDKVSQFNGLITIELAYDASDDKISDGLSVYYIDDNGVATKIMFSNYDNDNKTMKFLTNHLSTYAVAYEEFDNKYNDLGENAWYYASMRFACLKGIFNGVTDNMIKPNEHMTRAMFVTALYRMDGCKSITNIIDFVDVQDNSWYSDSVNWAYANKIINGNGNNIFGTNDNIKREDIAVMLYRYAEQNGFDVSSKTSIESFKDSKNVSNYARNALEWAVANELIDGNENNELKPKDVATRCEVATILMRFIKAFVK